ncbi:hypothetical protein [Gemmatimonas sp.]
MSTVRDEMPRAIEDAVAQLRAEAPLAASDALLARIEHSRAEGARVLLPLTDAPFVSEAPSFGWWRGGMLAAGLAAIVVIAMWTPRPSADATGGGVAMGATVEPPATADDAAGTGASAPSPLAELLSPWPRVAYAQTPQGGRAGPFAPLSGLRPERVKLGRRKYVRLSGNAYHELLPHEVYELDVDTTHFEGRAAFRLVLNHEVSKWMPANRNGLMRHDTLWLDRTRLKALARHSLMGPLEVTQRFADSTLDQRTVMDTRKMTGLSRKAKRVSNDLRLRIDPVRPVVASEAMMRVLLQATPLSAGWQASIGVVSAEPHTIATRDAAFRNLRVSGGDTLQTFSGRYPVWRVEVDNGRFPEVWHVSQETGEVLLVSGPWNEQSYPRSESHLIGGLSETKRLPAVKGAARSSP